MSAVNPRKDKSKKKPYEIKRADLNLDEYRVEQESKEPSRLFKRGFNHLLHSTQFWLYVLIQLLAVYCGFGQIFFCVGVLWSFYANTGKRKEGEMSAYSLFNEGIQGYSIQVLQ